MTTPKMTYFDLQAHVGTTKHLGGFETTRELIQLLAIDGKTTVLEVGCGAGATACYLARTYGCRVVGVDLRPAMVELSRERAQKQGLADRVEFRVADAQDLPLEDGRFDVAFCESVATFVEDKQQVANELARVVKSGGRVGLNEEIWLQPPPADLVREVKRIWQIKPDIPTADDWRGMLERVDLVDVAAKTYEFSARREASQIKRYTLGDTWRMMVRSARMYATSPEFRTYMKERRRLPKDVWRYLGYALFVGTKNLREELRGQRNVQSSDAVSPGARNMVK
jgi:ubiquinone/menaquinone biosynthesis C-methylase UbiE